MANAFVLKRLGFVPTRAKSRSYSVSLDSDPAAIRPQWRELELGGVLTPFQSQAWLLPWYEIVAPALGIMPVIATVREETTDRPVMLLLLCQRLRLGIVRIEFPDLGVSDYNAPILAPDFQPSEEEFAAIWDDIMGLLPRVDMIKLEKMPATVANRPNPMVRLAGSRRMNLRAWGFDLPKTRVAYDKLLKSYVRSDLRRRRRKLDAEGRVRFLRAQSEADGRKIFEMLRRQRFARFLQLARPDVMRDPVFSRFYETVIFDNWTKGFGVLAALMVGSETAATSFGLNYHGRYYLLVHSFISERWRTKAPGILAIDSMITSLIESGTKYFDFTIGSEEYKFRFGVKENLLYFNEIGLNARGRAFAAIREARRFAGNQVRRLPKQYWSKALPE